MAAIVQKTINVGVNALAREIGLKPSTVSAKMKRGMTPEQIRRDAAQKHLNDKRMEAVRAIASGKRPPVTTSSSSTSASSTSVPMPGYQPARVKQTDKTLHRAGLVSQSEPRDVDRASDPEFPSADSEDEFNYDEAVAAHKEEESMNAARLRRASALADEKELQNAQKLGELIPVVQVKMWGTKCLTAFRDKLMQAASEMSDELAAETRAGRVRDKLEKRFRAVLSEIQQLEELWGRQTEAKGERAA